jgi:hypothetical protein
MVPVDDYGDIPDEEIEQIPDEEIEQLIVEIFDDDDESMAVHPNIIAGSAEKKNEESSDLSSPVVTTEIVDATAPEKSDDSSVFFPSRDILEDSSNPSFPNSRLNNEAEGTSRLEYKEVRSDTSLVFTLQQKRSSTIFWTILPRARYNVTHDVFIPTLFHYCFFLSLPHHSSQLQLTVQQHIHQQPSTHGISNMYAPLWLQVDNVAEGDNDVRKAKKTKRRPKFLCEDCLQPKKIKVNGKKKKQEHKCPGRPVPGIYPSPYNCRRCKKTGTYQVFVNRFGESCKNKTLHICSKR